MITDSVVEVSFSPQILYASLTIRSLNSSKIYSNSLTIIMSEFNYTDSNTSSGSRTHIITNILKFEPVIV